MTIHVAILMRRYIDLILCGRKTVESRLSRTRRPPLDCVSRGDRIYFKASAGPFMATAVADGVEFHEDLTPAAIDALRRRLNDAVCGDAAYWRLKRDSRFGTFIALRGVQQISEGPSFKPSQYHAWFMLDAPGPCETARPRCHTFDVTLTDGAIRNGYVRVPETTHRFPPQAYGGNTKRQAGKTIELILPNGDRVHTDVVANHMIRWRGWRTCFGRYHVLPGDVTRFEQLSPWRYGVRFIRPNSPP